MHFQVCFPALCLEKPFPLSGLTLLWLRVETLVLPADRPWAELPHPTQGMGPNPGRGTHSLLGTWPRLTRYGRRPCKHLVSRRAGFMQEGRPNWSQRAAARETPVYTHEKSLFGPCRGPLIRRGECFKPRPLRVRSVLRQSEALTGFTATLVPP